MTMFSGSRLERLLRQGDFVVTAELGPPRSAEPGSVLRKARMLKGYADALNLTDNQTAMVRMSSVACSVLVMQEGLEPILQMTCRDRNRIAMQSELLGASALGIRNLLCITGDPHTCGTEKDAMDVFDVNSNRQLSMFRRLRDESIMDSGFEVKAPPKVFLGAAADPMGGPPEIGVTILEAKVVAGADFIQTQAIFDVDGFDAWMDEVRRRGVHQKIFILPGVIPLKSVKAARYMHENVPGIEIPDHIMERMKAADDPPAEGVNICLELIDHLRSVEGVHGIHIMAVAWESVVPEIVKRAGLYPRPDVRP